MKISSKILALFSGLVIVFCSLGLSGINSALAQQKSSVQDLNTILQLSAEQKFKYPLNDSLIKILCDKKNPFFIKLDPDTGQTGVDLNAVIKFTVVDSFVPKRRYEWDRFGVDTDSVFISIETRNWSVENVLPHSFALKDSIFEVDCEYYPDQPFDWSDTIKIYLYAQDVSYLRNSADTTYYFYTMRDGQKPTLTPIFPLPEMVAVPIDSMLKIHGEDIGRGVELNDIKLKIDDAFVVPVITGDPMNFEISYIPATNWAYNDSVRIYCEVNDLDGNVTSLEYWFKTFSVPAAPQLLFPQNDVVDQDTSLTFEWYASDRATEYHLQVATDPIFQDLNVLKVNSENLSDLQYAVDGLARNTVYYWRVRARNAAGYSQWSERWHFMTSNPPAVVDLRPAPPRLLSPPDNAIDQNWSLTLTWQPSDGAGFYRVQMSRQRDFSSIIISEETKGLNFELSDLIAGKSYYWRVNASNLYGTSDWSEVWQFSTRTQYINRELLPPQLVFPENGATDVDTSITFLWNKSKLAANYELQVSLTERFDELAVNQSIAGETNLPVHELAQDSKYYWRVRASNNEQTSNWSEVWEFTTRVVIDSIPPLPPQLVAPPNGAVNVDTSVTLVWELSPRATRYGVQISFDSVFTNVSTNELEELQFKVDELLRDTEYYWRANASNEFGTSDWSAVWHFRTIPITDTIPPVIIAVDPDSGETDISITTGIDFKVWDDLSGVDEMSVYLDIVSSQVNVDSQQADVLNRGDKEIDFRYQPPEKFAYLDVVKVRIHAEDKAGNATDKYYEFQTMQEILANLKFLNVTTSAPGNRVDVDAPISFNAYITCELANCSESFKVCFYFEDNDEPFYAFTVDSLKKGSQFAVPESPTMQWLTEGKYPVTVVVDAFNNIREANEEDNEATIYVIVGGAKITVRSNPFTPNDDGINDEAEFNFEQFDVENPRLKIFNMHGKKVREFEGQNNTHVFLWDGRDSNGRALLPGIYLYILSDKQSPLARGCVVIAK